MKKWASLLLAVCLLAGLAVPVTAAAVEHNTVRVNETGVQNIALFGLDRRAKGESGCAETVIILSIDKNYNAIKTTFVSRDSLVDIGEFKGHDYGQSKLTHAFSWGGAVLAVRTLNRNFGMNITDYAYVNYYEFVELVDYMGGVLVDVDENEARAMNKICASELSEVGIAYEAVSVGRRRLSGAQALAYCRNRYSDSDLGRGIRNKEVLQALFDEMRERPSDQLPAIVDKLTSMCHTTLTDSQMLEIATWALASRPAFGLLTLPNEACQAKGGNWDDGNGWVWRYDMEVAAAELHRFIYEERVATTTTTSKPGDSVTTTTKAADSVAEDADVDGTPKETAEESDNGSGNGTLYLILGIALGVIVVSVLAIILVLKTKKK